MHLKHLSLTNYRNYARLEQAFPAQAILLQGDNAQGKTNLLEAIYYLATTRSPIVGSDRNLLNWSATGDPLPFARLVGEVERGGVGRRIEITLVREGTGAGEGRLARRFRLNGVDRRAVDLLGQLNVVLFLPQDIDLICGVPALRRRYLDVTLCQVDAGYCRHLQRYNHVLVQRNHLLRRLREGRDDPAQLGYWDEQLAQWGTLITGRRQQAVQQLGTAAAEIQPSLTSGAEGLILRYDASIPGLGPLAEPPPGRTMASAGECPAAPPGRTMASAGECPAAPPGTNPNQAPAPQVEAALAALRQARPRDLASAMTSVGPHRDELRFLSNGVDMGIFGSRGQQRTIALALKLAEVRFMAGQTGEMPVLLLDDVMSELDRARGHALLQAVDSVSQILITATDLSSCPHEFLSRAALWQVSKGEIQAQ